MKYTIHYTDKLGNKPILSREFSTANLRDAISRQVKQDIDAVRKALSYWGDAIISITANDIEVAKGSLRVDCFGGRDNLRVELV